jgi:hypothetical protein
MESSRIAASREEQYRHDTYGFLYLYLGFRPSHFAFYLNVYLINLWIAIVSVTLQLIPRCSYFY